MSRLGTATAPPTVTGTPRLLPSTYGWWYLGGGQPVLLGPGAVDAAGTLDPAVELRLLAGGAHGPTPVRAYALTALVTTACNLGCGYCFQNLAPAPPGGSRPARIDGASMSRRTARETVDFAAARMTEAGLTALDLHLSGGEPLLNPAGCRDLLEFARQRGLRSARLTTNGTLLTASLARELADAGLGSVRITFDGRRADHDLVRVRRSGGAGSFDVILARLAKAGAATALRWNLRVNVSQHNRDGLPELIDELAARVEPGRCSLTFDPIRGADAACGGPLRRDPELADEFVRWIVRAAERGFRIRPPTAALPCRSCSVRSGRLGAVVNADGVLYGCVETAGRRGAAVGTVCTGFLPAPEIDRRWVGCGRADRGVPTEAAAAALRFQDAVDGRILDLHAAGLLALDFPAPPADQPVRPMALPAASGARR
jgi:uncharacterized protein